MNRSLVTMLLIIALVNASAHLASAITASPLPAGCANESGLIGRTDILKCESWESATWWQNQGWYIDQGDTGTALDGRRFNRYPADATSVRNTQIVSNGCISGSCLKVNMWKWNNPDTGGYLTLNWIIPGQGGCSHSILGCVPQQDVYLRYYLKLSSNFNPDGASVSTGSSSGAGGKFPGLADATNQRSADGAQQCGNGGAAPINGTECWSLRTTFQPCFATYNGSHNVCAEGGNAGASTRFGWYPYLYRPSSPIYYSAAYFDSDGRGNSTGSPCTDTYQFSGGPQTPTYGGPPYCGSGVPGLINNRWYLVELHTKMNTPGVANGVMQAWIDGVLRYEKTNVNFRNVGHNNLGVRQAWFDIFIGGSNVGMQEDMSIYLDQMALATTARLGPIAAQASNPLATLAASMQPGTWAELPTINMNETLQAGGSSHSYLPYSDDMVWDPTTEQVFYIGADHLAPEGPQFISYSAITNTWQKLPRPSWLVSLIFFHGYEHTAIDAARGLIYHRPYGDRQVHRYEIATQTWTDLPLDSLSNGSCCEALSVFPDMNGLIWVRGDTTIQKYDESTNQWIQQATGLQLGGTWHQSEYDPIDHVLIFYSANFNQLYKMTSSGMITTLGAIPINLYDGFGYVGNLTIDPATGTYLALTATARQFYTYNINTNVWTLQNNPTLPDMTNASVVSTPISTYGVTMFAMCRGSIDCHTYLYKHSGNTSPPPPQDTIPPTITNVTSTNIGGSEATISWTTNEIADSQVEYGRTTAYGSQTVLDTALVLNHTQTLSGLNPSTTYNYRVKSQDGSGNLGNTGNFTFMTTGIAPVDSGLVGRWPLDEGAGNTTADIAGSNPGTLVNGPAWVVGKVGNALQFNASDDGNDANDPRVLIGRTFNVNLPFTFSAWINPSSFADYRAIFSKRDSASASGMRFDIGLSPSTGRVYLYSAASYLLFNYGPPLNAWTHLAVTFTSSGTKLYVNGILNQTLGAFTLGTNTTAQTAIGVAANSDDPYKGLIDDVRIYGQELSAADIQTVFADTGGSIPPPPDTMPPIVSVVPADGQAFFDGFTKGITVNTSDNVGTAKLTINVQACDAAGNCTASSPLVITKP